MVTIPRVHTISKDTLATFGIHIRISRPHQSDGKRGGSLQEKEHDYETEHNYETEQGETDSSQSATKGQTDQVRVDDTAASAANVDLVACRFRTRTYMSVIYFASYCSSDYNLKRT